MEKKHCEYCGAELMPNAKFCNKCGKEISHSGESMKKNRNLTRCKACGALVARSAKACPHCGAKTTGQLVGESITGIGCGLLAVPIIFFLIIFYYVFFNVLK